jgi:hypothetical protein
MESIPPTKLVPILKYSIASGLLLVWSVTFTKLSVAFMLLRLQQGKIWTWSLLTAIFVLVTTAIVFTCFSLAECNPLSAAWNFVLDPSLMAKCMDPNTSWAAALSISGIYIAQVVVY